MKKKLYFKPETQVIELKFQPMMIVTSETPADPNKPVMSREDEFSEEEDYVKINRSSNVWDDTEELEDESGW